MTTISATTILRSRNASAPDKVLSTLLLRYPRFIHAELMTHRALSRNAASSRAIPVKKIIGDILADTAMPIHWGANQKGMQASAETDAKIGIWLSDGFMDMGRENAWLHARDQAISTAKAFVEAGYHKQVVNRLLEPFMHITVLVSATEWDNFLELRDHPDAEPHIQILAREIRKELDRTDNIQSLQPGEWHLPFMTRETSIDVRSKVGADNYYMEALIRYSVACAASTSYKTVDGFDMTLERANTIYDKLVNSKPVHASPLEHVAQADSFMDAHEGPYGEWRTGKWMHSWQHANFIGFRQHRHMIGGAE